MARKLLLRAVGPRRIARLLHEQDGFASMLEVLTILVIFALLVGIIVPNIYGFLGRGREEAFRGDRRSLQIAVDAYNTDLDLRITLGGSGYSAFPTDYSQDGAPGLVTRATNVVINMPVLVSRGFLRQLPESAAPANVGDIGHYVWIIESATGTVYGCSSGTAGTAAHTWDVTSYEADCGYNGQYP